ncbi:DUF397 domain-containing protein [Streptomyces sp. HB2AG]|uniref:DUF397 domain-containing protein n=1 Tax=Streptomyces sp. HB2AG TaxID=2983400 RepID=UPI0022AB4495|nr:DUF397 domain-containing protein [Streptomyces sp. HB2AG]MCZ2524509.1 DUF397 domain-containing protein [Streptomyces sp. HB2AG]
MNTEAPRARTEQAWFKSSYSGGEGGQCVEVAAGSGTVHVRDSKDRTGPVLSFTADEWAAFVEFAARG